MFLPYYPQTHLGISHLHNFSHDPVLEAHVSPSSSSAIILLGCYQWNNGKNRSVKAGILVPLSPKLITWWQVSWPLPPQLPHGNNNILPV